MNAPREPRSSLWMLTAGPTMWATHFLLCYVTAAIWCAKVVGRAGGLDGARLAVAGYTVVALLGIGAVGYRGFRQQGSGWSLQPRRDNTAQGRHHFLGFSILLLAGLSAVAVIYVALPALLLGSCR